MDEAHESWKRSRSLLSDMPSFHRRLRRIGRLRSKRRLAFFYWVGRTLAFLLKAPIGTFPSVGEFEFLVRVRRAWPSRKLPDQQVMLVTLFTILGDHHFLRHRKLSRKWYSRALCSLLRLRRRYNLSAYSKYLPQPSQICICLDYPLPPRIHFMLMRDYELLGLFDKAENELWRALDASGHRKLLMRAGVAFYQRLLATPERELSRGALPLCEVKAGLSDLEKIQSPAACH